jgi:uncharacterized integral membrane protein
VTRGLVLALILLPRVAEACATCIASPYGDRTYNWPYLFLIVLPFAVAVVVGGVLVHANGGLRAFSLRRVLRRLHPAARQEETTWPR